MTTVPMTTDTKARSAAWFADKLRHAAVQLSIVFAAGIAALGLLGLVVFDVGVGAVTLIVTFTDGGGKLVNIGGFIASMATSVLTMLLWAAVMLRRWIGCLAVLPATAVTLIDTYLDANFVTYMMYDEVTMINTWLLPENAPPMFIATKALVALLTFANEPCVMYLRRYLSDDLRLGGDV